MEDVFTLSWDDFNQKCPKVFKELWLDTDLSDVTLATEDNDQFSAHKVILAASSPFFKRLLEKNQNPQPLLFLMGVKTVQLRQLLSYIYLGKCDLTQEQLPAFMATGKQLEIEGLSGDMEESKEYYTTDEIGEPPEDTKERKEYYSPSKTTELSGKVEESEDSVPQSETEMLESDSEEKNEPMQQTDGVSECRQTDVGRVPNEMPETDIANLNNSSRRWKCDQCDYQTSYVAHLRKHSQNVHEGFKYNCTSCDYKSGDKSNLKRHIEKNHLGISYYCEMCKYVTKFKNSLKTHIDIKHNGHLYHCDTCPYIATKKKSLETHIMVRHKGVTQDCHLCNHKNNTKEGLRNHIKIEHEGLRYECLECDGIFTARLGLKRHIKSVHKGVKVDCDMCGLKLSSRSLSVHKQNVHFKAKVYGAKTLTETIFSMMIELSSGWKCKHCGKESNNKGLLKMHIKSEHMGMTHTCEICGHEYKTEETYRKHLRQSGACKLESVI